MDWLKEMKMKYWLRSMKLALDFAIGNYFIGNEIGEYGNFLGYCPGIKVCF